MNRGVLIKSWRETWPPTLVFGLALLALHVILALVLPKFQSQLESQLSAMPFLRNVIGAMIGTDVSGGLGPEMFAAIPWVHPVVLALSWAHAIVLCTRIPAGEVDRGTIDVLLALPVSRWRLFATEAVVWLGASVCLMLFALVGNAIGTRVGGNLQAPPIRWLLPAAANLLAVNLAVGALAWLASSLSDRRGRAIAVTFLVILAWFVLNYLGPFWEPARKAAWLSVLHYHQPLRVIQAHHWPLRDLIVLSGAAAGLWAMAGAVFARRDLATT